MSLTHLDAAGAARMVDVSAKAATAREAVAEGVIAVAPDALAAICARRGGQGRRARRRARRRDHGGEARPPSLIPLCHPLPLSGVDLDLTLEDGGIRATATVRTTHNTGVEMEALTAVSVALLTVYDMAKSIDRGMVDRRRPPARQARRAVGRVDRRADAVTPLLGVDEAQARLLGDVAPLPVEDGALRRRARPHPRRRRRRAPDPAAVRGVARWTAMRSAGPTCPGRGGSSARAPPGAASPGRSARARRSAS